MPTASILSLGTRQDALRWRDCVRDILGFTINHDLRAARPTLNEIKAFFGASDDWLFIAGHFNGYLYNEGDSIGIYFQADRVRIRYDGAYTELSKGQGFKQHQNLRTVFWGGCNTNSDTANVATLRALFGTHLLIGWKGLTGWEVLHSVMGGFGTNAPHANPHFFDRIHTEWQNRAIVRNRWLETAIATQWGNGSTVPGRFSVIDPDGHGWLIQNNAVAPDPAYPG